MQKRQKRKNKFLNILIYTAIFSTLVLSGVESFAASSPPPLPVSAPIQQTPPVAQSGPNKLQADSIPKKNAEELKNFEKTGEKNGLVKFVIAMLGVLVSSLVIFLCLKLYKKFNSAFGKGKMGSENFDYENSLDSPKDFKEAINLFLHKSDK